MRPAIRGGSCAAGSDVPTERTSANPTSVRAHATIGALTTLDGVPADGIAGCAFPGRMPTSSKTHDRSPIGRATACAHFTRVAESELRNVAPPLMGRRSYPFFSDPDSRGVCTVNSLRRPQDSRRYRRAKLGNRVLWPGRCTCRCRQQCDCYGDSNCGRRIPTD